MSDTTEQRKAAALDALRLLATSADDPEASHLTADKVLLAYINDPEITEAYDAIHKWYS